MTARLIPPFTTPTELNATLRTSGHVAISPADLCQLVPCKVAELNALQASWDDLPPDAYLRDGGHYRRRRHACCVIDGDVVTPAPHRAHWQPVEYNALHGGLERWFDPVASNTLARPVWAKLLRSLARTCSAIKRPQPWFVETHQFRIDTTDGIGRPTPEGAHRDGVDFVAVILVNRVGVKGGETRVFEAAGPNGIRFTMTEPWTTLLLDDERVIHESTPIQPLASSASEGGHRDTLVITFRAHGFQGK
ncbi:MAG: 2OG-Fe dioxygenase family protein [Cytophagales bacterium]|nr:2OG-Fe dioxygenase family protein [Rhizobacter sp.]